MSKESENVIETVIAVVPPEPNTDEMVNLISNVLGNALDQLRELFPFTSGDVMSACMHMVVETGLLNASPEKLRNDVITGLDSVLAEKAEHRRKAN